nr:glycosyltransferase family 39 protein [Thermoleophilaceae bacterium]
MPVGDYLIGIGFAIVVWGGAAAVAEVVVRRRLPDLRGTPRLLASVLLGLATLIAAHLLPGTVGLLSREAVALVLMAAALAAWRLVPRLVLPPEAPRAEVPASDGRLARVMAGLAIGAVGVLAIAFLARLVPDPPDHVDALSFGLPGIAEWIRTGSLLEVGAFFPLFEVRTYPNNGDVVYLAAVLPFGNDSFVRFPAVPLLALTGLAVYAIGRELNASFAPAALAAALVLAVPTVGEPALEHIKPDVFMYATFAAGLLFLLRHGRTGAGADLLLAGTGLGLAFGARWYGISSVIAVVFVWALATLLARRGVGQVARQSAGLAGVILAAGGYWLVRNALLTGNPVYPVDVSPFGITIFGAPPNVFAEGLGASLVDRIGLQ